MLLRFDEHKHILESLEGREKEDFERDAKETISVIERFLSVPPGKWSAKHSREWESAFSSLLAHQKAAGEAFPHSYAANADSMWAVTPRPPQGMSERQRRMLEGELLAQRRDMLELRFSYALGRVSEGDSTEDALRRQGIKKNFTRLVAAFRARFPEQGKLPA
jgi:hypothetical protein